jgi:RNA polymerase sigma factor (sigma-70 family)
MIRLSPAQRALAAPHVRLAQNIARSLTVIYGMFHYHDILRSDALEGLSKAAHTFDPSREVPFEKYAWHRIIGQVKNAIGKEARRLSLEGMVLDAAARIEDERPVQLDAEDDTITQLDGITAEVMAAFVMVCAGQEHRLQGEAGVLQREAYAELEEALSQLAPQDRRLIQLRYWDELPWEEVAGRLGIPKRTAKDHDLKIRRHLGAALAAPPMPLRSPEGSQGKPEKTVGPP